MWFWENPGTCFPPWCPWASCHVCINITLSIPGEQPPSGHKQHRRLSIYIGKTCSCQAVPDLSIWRGVGWPLILACDPPPHEPVLVRSPSIGHIQPDGTPLWFTGRRASQITNPVGKTSSSLIEHPVGANTPIFQHMYHLLLSLHPLFQPRGLVPGSLTDPPM